MSASTVETPVIIDDQEITAEVDAFLSSIQTKPVIPNYGGLKYTAAWWEAQRAAR